ncbi:MAG TPA: AbrB/MazE/SpoVT family DNA-binding domain-containing protein [Thermomicrobiaceae bacterium]|nr:AbrB/MazE/SpoVT family DNA-binding domain-containing protein [Thermomicrobiaceae bacterium]
MAERIVTVTRTGQITIPTELRRALGIAAGDKVALSLVEGMIQVIPIGSVTTHTAGALKGHGASLSVDGERWATEEGIAWESVRRAEAPSDGS